MSAAAPQPSGGGRPGGSWSQRQVAQRLGILAIGCAAALAVSSVLLATPAGRPAALTQADVAGAAREREAVEPPASAPSLQLAAAPTSADRARLQELSFADDLDFKQPYVPPADLGIFWGKSSFKGHYALGRVSSAQRVRKVRPCSRSSSRSLALSLPPLSRVLSPSRLMPRLRQVLGVGTFTGNHWEDSHHGHGKLLQGWDTAAMQGLARTCCATIVVPPMENDLPLYFKSSDAAINIKSFVSNGNRLIMTGGSFTSLVFLNRYFKFDLKKVIYDKGPFEKQPMSADPETAAIIKRLPAALPQEGMAVTTVDLHSLPMRTTAIYATFTSTPMFEMTYCEKPLGYPLHQACLQQRGVDCDFMQRGLRGYWCGYNKGMMCTEQATPEECEEIAASNAARNESVPCSCGSIIYDGYDFIGNHKTWMGASVWDSTLRSAVELPEMGEEGVATWPAPPPPPPPPAPGPFWNLRVFSSHYPLRHAPDLNRLAYVGDAAWDAHLDIDSRASITDLIEGLDNYYGQGSYPSGSWAGVFYGRLYIEVEGMYTWCTTSIDGSRIFVGGIQVLANDQRHSKPTGEASCASAHPISRARALSRTSASPEGRRREERDMRWRGWCDTC
jgi:hypothetical protein